MLHLAEPHVLSLEPYVPGRAIENDSSIKAWAKLGSNENCLGPSQASIKAAARALSSAHLYPNAKRLLVIDELCRHLKDFSVKPNQIALGNGTSEIIVNLVRGLVGSDERLLYGWPSFIMYRQAAQAHGRQSIAVPLKETFAYDLSAIIREVANPANKVKLVIIANPNNPTGNYLNHAELKDFIVSLPKDVVLVIDEAYFEYVTKEDYPNGLAHALSRPRTVVLRTFSKVYGLAGLRLGYAIGDKDVIAILCRIRDPFNVNCVVQEAAMAALDDVDHIQQSIEHNLLYRPKLTRGLRELGFIVHDSVGNFLMAERTPLMPSIKELCQRLLTKGIILRPLDSYDLNNHVRVSVGTKGEIAQLFDGLKAVLPGSFETCLLL
jgi:histidinol-phosphate aminotransferase